MTSAYVSSLQELFALHRHGIKLGLETIASLLADLQNPQSRYLTLHIGGTNGKGSTAAITASILQAAGCRVGLYTSPHLVDFRERIRVQGQWIPEHRVLDIMRRIRREAPTPATFFEFTTAMAFQYFAEEQVDIVVVEVGMGGRFDATNMLQPAGVAITNVAMDHEAYLGDTLASIAGEKAGIIKPRVPTVVGPMPEEALKVIQERAAEARSDCWQWNREFSVSAEGDGRFDYDGPTASYATLSCGLEGAHQQVNAACALALLEAACPVAGGVPEAAVRAGLSRIDWNGRLETVATDPWVVVDGAHNPAGAQVLADFIRESQRALRCRKVILGISMMQDKDHEKFVRLLYPMAHAIVVIERDDARAVPGYLLLQALSKDSGLSLEPRLSSASNLEEAWELTHLLAEPHDLICFTGSLYLVGEIKTFLENRAHGCVQG